jgi:putative transposase
MNLLKTSEVDSTSKEKDLMPYWNSSCLDMSQKLLSHTKTGCVGSDTNLLNLLPKSTTVTSWFSMKVSCHHKMNSSTTCFQSFTSSLIEYTDLESTVVRSKKIRIYPKNRQLARKYLGLSRWWYNRTIAYLNQPDTIANFFAVSKLLLNNKVDVPEWAFECPQRIRLRAIEDACNAVKNAKVKYQKTGEFQKVSFRAKHDPIQSFAFDKVSLNQNFVFGNKEFKLEFEASEPFHTDLEGTRIIREGSRYFVIIPQKLPYQVPENQRIDAVALDPGVRTFMSFYSEVLHGKMGEGDFKRIYRLCLNLDKLMSLISKAKCRQKRNLRKAVERIRWRIWDLINELHKKTANFLVRTFNRIFIPTFETSQMVTKLVSSTSRNMLTFAHYRFKQYLKARGQQAMCEVIEVSEAYTSKTCSYCGTQHKIGSKKRMKCGCGANVDRDLNGARGIFLRALSVTT